MTELLQGVVKTKQEIKQLASVFTLYKTIDHYTFKIRGDRTRSFMPHIDNQMTTRLNFEASECRKKRQNIPYQLQCHPRIDIQIQSVDRV